MKNYKDLINFVNNKIGTHYLYGYKGEIITAQKNTQLKKQYPGIWSNDYIKKANSWIGQYACDCSGLISWFTGIIRGSSQYKETATQIKKYNKGMDLSPYIGWAAWRQGHIGIIVGPDDIAEARGINYGTVKTKASQRNFTHILKLCDIDYNKKNDETQIGWYKDSHGWWYRHTIGTGPETYYHDGIFMVPTSRGLMFFGFDSNGYMLENINDFYITDFGNIEVKRYD